MGQPDWQLLFDTVVTFERGASEAGECIGERNLDERGAAHEAAAPNGRKGGWQGELPQRGGAQEGVAAEAGEGGGVIIRAGGERLQASAPLRTFLLRGSDPTKVLPKLVPHFAGKTLSLDVERTAAGFVVHNLS